jgi:hypothetical protein
MQRAKMIPMSSPGWFDDFPEYRTETEYRDLSEEISRTIEIVHGHVIKPCIWAAWPRPSGCCAVRRALRPSRPPADWNFSPSRSVCGNGSTRIELVLKV